MSSAAIAFYSVTRIACKRDNMVKPADSGEQESEVSMSSFKLKFGPGADAEVVFEESSEDAFVVACGWNFRKGACRRRFFIIAGP